MQQDNKTTFIGIDASKNELVCHILYPGQTEGVTVQIHNNNKSVKGLVRQIKARAAGPLLFGYEAGCLGYSLQRGLTALGSRCDVLSPLYLLKGSNSRIKTDRRDARNLALILRDGYYGVVPPPSLEQETARDLVRQRHDINKEIRCWGNKLAAMNTRLGTQRLNELRKEKKWDQLRDQIKLLPLPNEALFNNVNKLEQLELEKKNIKKQINYLSEMPQYADSVNLLKVIPGISNVTAMVILTEINNICNFRDAKSLVGYTGLFPVVRASGGKKWSGETHKQGNVHLRRVIYSAAMKLVQATGVRVVEPAWATDIASHAHLRLTKKDREMTQRQIPAQKIKVALARELACSIWELLSRQAVTNKAA